MNRLHECLLEILLDIDVALTKSDIPYFVVGGSSIGHARNGKFIPWDDDIDLVFDDVYSDRVAESLMDNLSEKYIIEFPNSKENHRSYFRVVMRDTTISEIPMRNILSAYPWNCSPWYGSQIVVLQENGSSY